MKELLFVVILGSMLISCGTSKKATEVTSEVNTTEDVAPATEQNRPENGESGPRRGGNEGNREEYLAMTKSLNLNAEQEIQFEAINSSFQSKMQKKREEARSSGSFEGMREEMRTLRDQQNGAIKNLLTEKQFEIYNAFIEAQRAKRGERRGGGRG